MKSADYWRERFTMMEDAAHKQGDQYLKQLDDAYRDAVMSIRRDIESWYQRLADNNEVSLLEARKMLTAGQLEEFKWTVEQYVKIGEQVNLSAQWRKKLENASARFHISRLEAIQIQIQQQVELLYGNRVAEIDGLLRNMVANGYSRTVFETQKGIGFGWDIAGLDQKKLDRLLTKPWTTDGRTFSDRIWSDQKALTDSLHKELVQGILRGDAPQKTINSMRDKLKTDRYKAGRLVHTETTYFNGISKLQAFRDMGVKMVEIVETLDLRTCSICQPMDSKVLPLEQCEPGVTIPPFHPNCRGTICPYYDDELEGERAARDADGEVYYVPEDMDYEQWKGTFAKGGDAEDELTVIAADGIIKLTKDEQWALNKYISSESYKINAALRENFSLSDAQKKLVKYLDAALEKMPIYKGTAIRSLLFDQDDLMGFASEHTIGSQVVYKAYSSASTKRGYHDSPTVILRIQSKTGRDIRCYNTAESEILFSREASFRVLHAALENGVYVLEMEEV